MTLSRGAVIRTAAVVLVGLALCGYSIQRNLAVHHEARAIALTMLSGLSFLLVGAYTALLRPGTPVGGLMMWVAIALFSEDWQLSQDPFVYWAGCATSAASTAAFGHLMLAYPEQRVRGRTRWVLVAAYLCVPRWDGLLTPGWWLSHHRITDAVQHEVVFGRVPHLVNQLALWCAPAVVAVVGMILLRRFLRVDGDARRRLLPAYGTGLACVLSAAIGTALRVPHMPRLGLETLADTIGGVAFLLWPYTFVLGTLAQHNAEQRAEVEQSRARIVSANLDARRKVERDIHDGAQQHLVALAVRLRLVEADLVAGKATPADVARCATDLETALAELRELSRGLHPALVTEFGLGVALRELTHRSSVPVSLHCDLARRLDPAIEVAVYFAVSEALTNTAKHARARQATVVVSDHSDHLTAEVYDDGSGGADPAGSGLRGVADRLAGLGGELAVESPAERGTTLRLVVPTERAVLP